MADAKPKAWQSLLVMLLLVILVAVVLVALFVLSLGTIGLALVVGGMLFLVVAFHYIAWGWWLGPAIQREVEAEEREAEER